MRLVDIVFVAAGAAALYGGYSIFLAPAPASEPTAAEGPRLPLVEVAPVAATELKASVRQTALLRPAAEVVVTAEAAGRIAWVNPTFELGQRLAKGAEVFRLDTARLETGVARAQADVAVARADLQRIADEFARISALVERNVSAQANLVTTAANVAAAEARVAQAEAALRAAQIALDEATVTAPFDAVVTAEALSPGQFVQAGTEVGRLVAADRAELLVRLNPEQLRLLESTGDLLGRAVTIRTTDGSGASKTGAIRQVSFRPRRQRRPPAFWCPLQRPLTGRRCFG